MKRFRLFILVGLLLVFSRVSYSQNDSIPLAEQYPELVKALERNDIEKISSLFSFNTAADHIKLIKEHIRLNSKKLSPVTLASYEEWLGTLYKYTGEFDESEKMYNSALKRFKSAGDRKGIELCKFSLAELKIRLGVVDQNVMTLQNSLEYYTAEKDTTKMIDILGSLAFASGLLNEEAKSISYRKRVVELSRLSGNCRAEANAYRSLGENYRNLDSITLSEKYLMKSLQKIRECNHPNSLSFEAMVWVSLAELSIMKDSTSDPDSVYAKSQAIFKLEDNKYWYAFLFRVRSRNKLRLNQTDDALVLAREGYEYSKQHKLKKELVDNLDALFRAYEKLGDYENAFKYYKLHQTKRDSLVTEEGAKASVEVDMKLKSEREKFEMQLEHTRSLNHERNRKNMWLFGSILVFLSAGGMWSRLRYMRKSKKEIEEEKDRSEHLLLNILPEEIAEELKKNGKSEARDYDLATIVFTDFKEFTQTSEKMSAAELVSEIDHCFKAFDQICEKYTIEKVKTIGDSYMAVGGLPVPTEDSVTNTVLAGLEMANFILDRKVQREAEGKIPFEMRVGINTGPVVAGIVGVKKFQYDIWGDTVNTASRMESNCEVGKVNISESTYEQIKDDPQFSFESRGKIEAKGKGMIQMYFVSLS